MASIPRAVSIFGKGLRCFGVGRMHDDLGRLDDIYVHFEPHLEKEKFRVGLQAVYLEHLGVIGVVHAHPKVRVDARSEVPQNDGVSGIPTIGITRCPLKR